MLIVLRREYRVLNYIQNVMNPNGLFQMLKEEIEKLIQLELDDVVHLPKE